MLWAPLSLFFIGERMLPDGLMDVTGSGKECAQHFPSEETPASISELPAPEPTLPKAVSTVSGNKLTLSLPSTTRTSEAGQKLPTKDQLYPPYWLTHVGSTLHRIRHFSKPPSFYGRALWAQHGSIRNTSNTTSTDCMTWSSQDLVDRTEGTYYLEKI